MNIDHCEIGETFYLRSLKKEIHSLLLDATTIEVLEQVFNGITTMPGVTRY